MRERRAPRWFDVPVCCDCRRELGPADAKVSAGTGWRCSDCEYRRLGPAREHVCAHPVLSSWPTRLCGRPATHRVRCNIEGREWCYVCGIHAGVWRRSRPSKHVEALAPRSAVKVPA